MVKGPKAIVTMSKRLNRFGEGGNEPCKTFYEGWDFTEFGSTEVTRNLYENHPTAPVVGALTIRHF